MALAYVTGNTGTATSTSLTLSTDCTGADILLVGFTLGSGTVTSVTYNGVSMTLATSNTSGISGYLYYLVAPSSGTNNVVITPSGSTTINAISACYSGAKQTGQPDATSNASDVLIDEVGQNVTTIADNCFVVAFGGVSLGSTLTRISSGTTRSMANKTILFDNGPKTPAGSVTSTYTSNIPSDVLVICIASISPSTGVTNTGFFF